MASFDHRRATLRRSVHMLDLQTHGCLEMKPGRTPIFHILNAELKMFLIRSDDSRRLGENISTNGESCSVFVRVVRVVRTEL